MIWLYAAGAYVAGSVVVAVAVGKLLAHHEHGDADVPAARESTGRIR